MRNQLKNPDSFLDQLSWKDKTIIEDAIEVQINWLDANNNAKTEEYKRRRIQMESIVARIGSAFNGQSFNQSRAKWNQYQGQI